MSTSGKLRHSIESLRERQLWAGITWIVHQLFDHAAADQMAAVSPFYQMLRGVRMAAMNLMLHL